MQTESSHSISAVLSPAEAYPVIILSEGCFGQSQSKLALGVIRYGRWPIIAVIDSTNKRQTVRDITRLDCDAPIVESLQAAMACTLSDQNQPARALMLGTAPPGGQLPQTWRDCIRDAIAAGLHIINGLHTFLSDDAEFVALAKTHQVNLWDVRDPQAYGHGRFEHINLQKPRPDNVHVITMVGTDCAVGKMLTALELNQAAQQAGLSSAFIATGQTGILITGNGVPLDRVIGDFMAGAVETCIQETITDLEVKRPGAEHYLFVEGQGSLMHPAYSGVTLALLHGSKPDVMVLCHVSAQPAIRNYPDLLMPTLRTAVQRYEEAAVWIRPPDEVPARVIGVSLNTSALSEKEAHNEIATSHWHTDLPTVDPIRNGVIPVLEAILSTLSPGHEKK